MGINVSVRKGESPDRALRRLKKKLDFDDVLRNVRAKRYFRKPSEEKRERTKRLKFQDMLRCRYRDL